MNDLLAGSDIYAISCARHDTSKNESRRQSGLYSNAYFRFH